MRSEQIPLDFNKKLGEEKPEYDLPFDEEAQPNYVEAHDWGKLKKCIPQKKKKHGGK